jgi:hypothetical protein
MILVVNPNRKTLLSDLGIDVRIIINVSGLRLRPPSSVLSPRRRVFELGSVYMGFVVDKAALGQGFLQVLLLSLSILFYSGSPYSYISPGG